MISVAMQALANLDITHGEHIYVVWQERIGQKPKCIYVGRTKRGVKCRLREHLELGDRLGQWLQSYIEDASVSIYEPDECMIAIEKELGIGWNPSNVGAVTAEECMIRMLDPELNVVGRD